MLSPASIAPFVYHSSSRIACQSHVLARCVQLQSVLSQLQYLLYLDSCFHAYALNITGLQHVAAYAALSIQVSKRGGLLLQVTCPGQQTLHSGCALHAGGPPRAA